METPSLEAYRPWVEEARRALLTVERVQIRLYRSGS